MGLSGVNPAEVLVGSCTIKVGPEGQEEDFGLTTEEGVRFRVKKKFLDVHLRRRCHKVQDEARGNAGGR